MSAYRQASRRWAVSHLLRTALGHDLPIGRRRVTAALIPASEIRTLVGSWTLSYGLAGRDLER